MDWKIFATLLITLGVLMAFFSFSPETSGFFSAVKDKFSVPESDNMLRNVSFSLASNSYSPVTINSNRLINLTIASDGFSAAIRGGNITAGKYVKIVGYKGKIDIGKELKIDGTFERINSEGLSTYLPGSMIITSVKFINLTVDNMALQEMEIQEMNGTLSTDSISLSITGKRIILKDPSGSFTFSKDSPNALSISGKATSININGKIEIN